MSDPDHARMRVSLSLTKQEGSWLGVGLGQQDLGRARVRVDHNVNVDALIFMPNVYASIMSPTFNLLDVLINSGGGSGVVYLVSDSTTRLVFW